MDPLLILQWLLKHALPIRAQRRQTQRDAVSAFLRAIDGFSSQLATAPSAWAALEPVLSTAGDVELYCPPAVVAAASAVRTALVDTVNTGQVSDDWPAARERFIIAARTITAPTRKWPAWRPTLTSHPSKTAAMSALTQRL